MTDYLNDKRQKYAEIHDAFYKERELWCLDDAGETLSDVLDRNITFTGTYSAALGTSSPAGAAAMAASRSTPCGTSRTYGTAPYTIFTSRRRSDGRQHTDSLRRAPVILASVNARPVPPYIYCIYATGSITVEDKPWSFTPSLIHRGPSEWRQEWLDSMYFAHGKRAHDRPGQDPESDIIARGAVLHIKDALLPHSLETLDMLDQERDIPHMVATAKVQNDQYQHPGCLDCLSYTCDGGCRLFGPKTDILDKLVVRASPISGYGVFARETIHKGSFICAYVGEVIGHEDTELRHYLNRASGRSYFYALDIVDPDDPDPMKRTGRSIDAAYLGNESRFINGTVDANCMTQIDDGGGALHLYASRAIFKGQELTLEYSLEGMPGYGGGS